MGIIQKVKEIRHAWNAFTSSEGDRLQSWGSPGISFGGRPDRTRMRVSNDKSIITAIYNQIGIDGAAVDMYHVRLDPQEGYRFVDFMDSGLNNCLTLEANIDEGARAFRQNAIMTMFDKGVIALVPVDTDEDLNNSNAFDIKTLRVGEIVAWFPETVRVLVYNDKKGIKEEVTLPKKNVAIVENPLYSIMNETNSTLQRLIRKLSLLDSIDEQSSSGKLDIIIQLPYVIKSESRRNQAESRRKDIEQQLNGSKYGIAYTDGTEKITQLNRPAENNMMAQVEYLTTMLYSQLGLTEDVFRGTASESVMINYYNRTLEPILTAIAQAMERTFLTKTARTRGQAIRFYRNPFKLVPLGTLAEIGDKLTRNEIVTGNEFRGFLGLRPSKDKRADELRNSNMPVKDTSPAQTVTTPERKEDLQNGSTNGD